jgi:RimJ/RimL family protein N-acetyltransferase
MPLSRWTGTTAPTLETARLRMRAHTVDDAAAGAALWAEPAVVRHISGQPSTPQQSWARLLNYAGHWALMRFGYWAVVDKASGLYVGDVGLADFRRAMEPSIQGVPELGWALHPSVHGRGYATEAVAAACAWGDGHLTGERTVCIIAPDNAASLRVAAKCGFREVVHATYAGQPTILFERFRKA